MRGEPRSRPLDLLQRAMMAACLAAASPVSLAVDCTASATGINFGAYDIVRPTPTDTTGTLRVTCTNAEPRDRTVSYTVTLSSGNGGSAASRWLSSGTHRLFYNLYRDAARVEVWGDGTAGSRVVSGTLKPGPGVGNATRSAVYAVYGRIPPMQEAAAGAYSDTIVFTLTF